MQPEYGTRAAIIFYITSKTLRLDAAVVVEVCRVFTSIGRYGSSSGKDEKEMKVRSLRPSTHAMHQPMIKAETVHSRI